MREPSMPIHQLMLSLGSTPPGTSARFGRKAPNGTFMNRLLSTNQTEHSRATAAPPPSIKHIASAIDPSRPTSLLI
jgi:hypothetical protein